MKYNWQHSDWPHFKYEVEAINSLILAFAEDTGEINGIIQGLSEELKLETLIELMLSESMKTSAIEGEFISREDIYSSIKNKMGLNETLVNVKDKRAERVTQLMIEVKKSYASQLDEHMLLNWHRLLMEGSRNINAGKWRKGAEPMQVVSGASGKELIHFEAPPSSDLPYQMKQFVQWFNHPVLPIKGNVAEAILKSAIAHLYFESIHPFEDGNGRIGRAIAEMALSQALGRPVLLSLSKIIEQDKKSYYEALKEAQQSLNLTNWINYFALVILAAQRDARNMIQFTLKKAQFFDRYQAQLNGRQLKAIQKMLAAGPEGYLGGMTARKYMSINKTSKATATRDMQELLELQVFRQDGAGRSIHYQLTII